MKRIADLLLAALIALGGASLSAASPSAFDLVGKWEGGIDFGRMKFKMILRVAKTPENRIAATMEIPEQGGMPLSAMLYNHPDIRLEFDRMGGAFTGKLNAEGNEIAGAFDDGPGGKAMEAKFKKSTEADKPEPVKIFTFSQNEPVDIRGYWKTTMEPFPGMAMRVGLKIGRLPDGTFSAEMDMIDQGAKDIPATKVAYTKPTATMEWQAFQATIEASLSEDGQSMSGEWKQRGKVNKVKLERLSKPATALPDGLSFAPDKSAKGDIRGYWKGTLDAQGQTLRLKIKIGSAEDASLAGSMISVDQGAREFPWTSVTKQENDVRMELKILGAVFSGAVNKNGSEIEGTWQQGVNPLPLKLERSTQTEFEKQN